MIKPRILIADDDKDLADYLAIRCRRMGAEVDVAHDGLTALNKVQFNEPDIVCLDVNMPGGTGLSVCEMLAGDERMNEIPVIILTGHTDTETIRRCHELCAYYVPKCDDVWYRIEPLLRELLECHFSATV